MKILILRKIHFFLKYFVIFLRRAHYFSSACVCDDKIGIVR